MKDIIFKKRTEPFEFDGYMFIYNFNVDFTEKNENPLEYLKVFARKHDLNTSQVISNAIQFYYKVEQGKIYLTPVRPSDLVNVSSQKNSYVDLIKKNSHKTVLTSRLKI